MSELYDACNKNDLERVIYLLEQNNYNIDLDYQEPENGFTPLHRAVFEENLNMVTLLLHRQANVNKTDKNEQSPLHIAVRTEETAIVQCLLNANAHVDAREINGLSPFHISCKRNNTEILQVLLEANADVNLKSRRKHFSDLPSVSGNTINFVTNYCEENNIILENQEITIIPYSKNNLDDSSFFSQLLSFKGLSFVIPPLIILSFYLYNRFK
eukprot:TRINITY_DN70_c5_g1_i1.p1 TRINITY_DN70_c5_g1~~TRINITY_DN70_c5_g1_i1.p1  ORF type:complete len:213 (-),score=44.56 TRINITY_DN70_c5_g1_i1:32-670(-)